MRTPFSGESGDDRSGTPPAQSTPAVNDDDNGLSVDVRVEDVTAGLQHDMSTLHIDQSPELVDVPRSASPAPTYRTVESHLGSGRSASPAPSYATIDPSLDRPDDNPALLLHTEREQLADSQHRVEEIIRQNAVIENMGYAFEHHPESFGVVRMIGVPVELNGHKTHAMIASAAASTIVPAKLAAKCGINDLVDTRYSGVARGIGTMGIVGKIPNIDMKIGHVTLSTSVMVMDGNFSETYVLIGKDTLSRYQACIDIKRNALVIQGHAVTFLGKIGENRDEKDIKDPGMQPPEISCDQLQQSPESKSMLYIPIKVNGLATRALIDSASQATTISPSYATACNLMRLLDHRFRGEAQGVGKATLLGRIHSAQVKIGDFSFRTTFIVMDAGAGLDLTLGVDFLRRFDVSVDLKQGAVLFRDQVVPFIQDVDADAEEDCKDTSTNYGVDDEDEEGTSSQKEPSGARSAPEELSSHTPTLSPPKPEESQISARPLETSAWPQNLISRIIEIGFTRDEAIYALDGANGDLEFAISMLI